MTGNRKRSSVGFPVKRGVAGLLIGEYDCSIDIKGRLNFPAKLREDLGDSFIISKNAGGEPFLCVYSLIEWQEKQNRLKSVTDDNKAALQRYLFSSACESSPDKQGRIVIPQKLREFAGLEKDVTVIGSDDHCEIWSAREWGANGEQMDREAIRQLAKSVGY